MKLICNVPPRRGGAPVKATGPSGAVYEFKMDDDGLMVADVPDTGDVAHFLTLGERFEPADEADFGQADQLLAEAEARRKAEAGESDDGQDDEDDDDVIDPDAPPLEANTPPKPPKAKAPKAKAPKAPKAAKPAAAD